MALKPEIGRQDAKATSRFLKALTHDRRETVLELLLEDERSIGLVDLSHRVVDESEELERSDAEQVYISLFHRHVPHLVDVGLITFDEEEEEETITITETATEKLQKDK